MAETSDDNNKKEQFNYYGVISSLIYISIIIAFGIPLWWKTTSPSRHSLPDISALLVSSQRIVHKFPISIACLDETIDRELLRSQLVGNWPQKIDGSLAYIYEWKVRPLVAKERTIFDDNHSSLLDIDDALNLIDGYSKKGKLWLYLLPAESSLSPQLVVFGKHRFIYIKNSELNFGEKSLPEFIVEVVESTLDLSNKLYNSKKTSLLLSPEIDVIVSIINENGNNDGLLSDKIDEIHRIADTGLISQSGVSELIKLNVISQVLHYTLSEQFISSHLYRTNDNISSNSNERLFEISDVPILMNTIESRIVEHNNKQSYHILLFIPSSQSLYFYDSTAKTKSNLIVTPYRGGILIWNKANDFVNGFRALTRNLLGLPQSLPHNSLRKNLFFNKWELDAIRRAISQTQLLKTLASLESINKLIEKVGNIVIIEEIAHRMHTAVDLSHQSIDCLAEADLNSAFKLSTRAYLSSETAFFDSSLLSLLYFPDDQKYAVYFPLFLPVSLPILSSIYYLFKIFKNRNKLKVD